MMFGIAKKEIHCHGCRGGILRGEYYTKLFFKTDTYNRVMFFHIQCYKDWVISKFENSFNAWYTDVASTKPARGRPRKYANGKEVHRKKALIRYHRLQGNWERVKELEEEHNG